MIFYYNRINYCSLSEKYSRHIFIYFHFKLSEIPKKKCNYAENHILNNTLSKTLLKTKKKSKLLKLVNRKMHLNIVQQENQYKTTNIFKTPTKKSPKLPSTPFAVHKNQHYANEPIQPIPRMKSPIRKTVRVWAPEDKRSSFGMSRGAYRLSPLGSDSAPKGMSLPEPIRPDRLTQMLGGHHEYL